MRRLTTVMRQIAVTTQGELDAALQREDVDCITIDSRAKEELRLWSSGPAVVHAYGSSAVRVRGQAALHAHSGATVHAYDQATVHAHGGATVHARGGATVHASDQAAVHAHDGATVHAGSLVVVYLYSPDVEVIGGVTIDLVRRRPITAAEWCAVRGVTVTEDGEAILYKATDSALTAGRGYDRPTVYTPGAEVVAADWRPDNRCGGGLHLSQSPWHADMYRTRSPSRFLRVAAPLDSMRVLGVDKVKVPRLRVLAEVDDFGRDLPAGEA